MSGSPSSTRLHVIWMRTGCVCVCVCVEEDVKMTEMVSFDLELEAVSKIFVVAAE